MSTPAFNHRNFLNPGRENMSKLLNDSAIHTVHDNSVISTSFTFRQRIGAHELLGTFSGNADQDGVISESGLTEFSASYGGVVWQLSDLLHFSYESYFKNGRKSEYLNLRVGQNLRYSIAFLNMSNQATKPFIETSVDFLFFDTPEANCRHKTNRLPTIIEGSTIPPRPPEPGIFAKLVAWGLGRRLTKKR